MRRRTRTARRLAVILTLILLFLSCSFIFNNLRGIGAVMELLFWLFMALAIASAFFLFFLIRRFDRNVSKLRDFASMAESGVDVSEADFSFSEDELGEISGDIVKLYSRLRTSEDEKTRLKRQLTQNMAHEFKTPVSSIRGYLETILGDADMPKETKRQFLERCYRQSCRLSNLLRDISVLTRIDESQPYEVRDVNIHDIIEEVKAETSIQLEQKKMTFLDLTEPCLVVSGNAGLLYSVFRNLTDNSIAYAGEGTVITVKVLDSAPYHYKFSFADNGVGVSPEHLPQLFNRFYRVDKGRSRQFGGTGLGLAIVKNSIMLHGGNVTASIPQGGGLEFVFEIRKHHDGASVIKL